MRNGIILSLMFFLSSNLFLAQDSSDYKLRIQNSFLKLYENPETAIHAAKEIRDNKNQLFTKDILTQGYLLKGDYIESVRIAFEKSDLKKTNQKLLTKLIIAREFYHLNLYEQTSSIIATYISKKPTQGSEEDDELYAQLYQLETKNFIALKKLDLAEKSLAKSSKYLKNNKNSTLLIAKENELLTANIALEKGNRKEALLICNHLLKDLSSLPRAKYLLALAQQFRAQLFFENQDYEQAIEWLKDASAAIEKTDYKPLQNSIYGDLARNYLVVKQNKNYELYKTKYNESSKYLEEQKKEARRELIQLSTELTSENNKLILQKKKTQLLYIVGISLVLMSLLLYIFIREIQKSKMLLKQIKFFRTINSQPKKIQKNEITSKKHLVIPKEKEEEILNGLEQFEESKNFLDNNMSLATLAVELNTNTKYLSEIINKYKDKNFNTYINELRIKHIIQLLSSDRSYLQYKISYIAEIGGFTSHSAFTNVFKSVTGMSPNEYIQKLRQE